MRYLHIVAGFVGYATITLTMLGAIGLGAHGITAPRGAGG